MIGLAFFSCSSQSSSHQEGDNNGPGQQSEKPVAPATTEQKTRQDSPSVAVKENTPPYEIRIKNASDSVWVEKLLQEGAALPEGTNIPLFYARKFLGKPYVGYTLDKDKEEGLVINTEQVDCTTFVENVVALTMCTRKKQTTFADFCRALVDVRYIGGEVAYTARQHYFTIWLEDNIKDSIVSDISLPEPPMSAKRKPNVNYMTTHVASYAMLNAHREWLPQIKAMEEHVNAITFTYIPKEQLAKSMRYKEYIQDGDIIGIVTTKAGLDISHVGFAVWHNDGLHLLHASPTKRIGVKVADDPKTMYQDLKEQPSSVGIRVARIQ